MLDSFFGRGRGDRSSERSDTHERDARIRELFAQAMAIRSKTQEALLSESFEIERSAWVAPSREMAVLLQEAAALDPHNYTVQCELERCLSAIVRGIHGEYDDISQLDSEDDDVKSLVALRARMKESADMAAIKIGEDLERHKAQMTRRRVLGGLASAAAVATIPGGLWLYPRLDKDKWDAWKNALGYHDPFAEINDLKDIKARVLEKYGIEMISGDSLWYADISGDNPTMEELSIAAKSFEDELGKYKPPDIFKRQAGTTVRARFVRDLKVKAKHGKKKSEGRLLADRTVIINIALSDNPEDREWEKEDDRGTFHHEFYHQLDPSMSSGSRHRDQEWEDMHTKVLGFEPYTYDAYDASADIGNAAPCFFNHYGSAGPREDRAVIAERLFSPEGHWKLIYKIISTKDKTVRELLAWKYRYVKKDYEEWSGGEMDSAYWERLLLEKTSYAAVYLEAAEKGLHKDDIVFPGPVGGVITKSAPGVAVSPAQTGVATFSDGTHSP